MAIAALIERDLRPLVIGAEPDRIVGTLSSTPLARDLL
jgi:hypothetical protein